MKKKAKKVSRVKPKEFYKDDNSDANRGMTHPKKWGSDDVEKKEKKSPAKKSIKKW